MRKTGGSYNMELKVDGFRRRKMTIHNQAWRNRK